MATSSFPFKKSFLSLLVACAGWLHAQEGSNSMVPTITQPSGFGIDTIGAFLCGSPATVPHGSKAGVNALEAAFSDRKTGTARARVHAPSQAGPALGEIRPSRRREPRMRKAVGFVIGVSAGDVREPANMVESP